ncbi:circadian clock-controlled protein daywake-like [Musca domestica]|uniref:Circadian clock-controlled protein daywake-like n=1 Tax=Musca domestica TaxID=7370 RepID=A0A9J7I563_MUSDO|nr:circadian clock-controlled protein daywake-like [Musca domestica]
MNSLKLCYFLVAVASCGLVPSLGAAFEWPFLKACTPKDELCQRKRVVEFFQTYSNGIPELDIPSLNPMYLGNINAKGQGNENLNLNINMIDVLLYNYTNIECLDVKGVTGDMTKPAHLTFKVKNPHLIVRTRCHLSGKLLIFNVEGETDLEVHMMNTTTVIDVDLEPYSEGDQSYFKATSFCAKQQTPSMKIFFKNSTLFNGDQMFADVFTDTINENWMLMRDEIQPYFEKANAKVSLVILNKILITIPSDQYFKDE